MTPGQARRLLQWSEQGGHLVLIAERLWDEDEKKSGDLLLDSLDIRQYLTEDFDDSQDRASEKPPTPTPTPTPTKVASTTTRPKRRRRTPPARKKSPPTACRTIPH